jgi:signal transduction histidine kinase
LLVEMEGSVGAAEKRRLGELKDQVGRYVTASAAVSARDPSPELAMQTLRPHFERAIATSAELRHQNEANRQASQAMAARALDVQSIVAGSSALLLLVGFTVVGIAIRRLILRPILNLQEAVERFRAGDPGDKASGGPLTEIGELADRFNEMTESMAQQRRNQLTFLAAVAHDLRNPLSALKLTVQSIAREPEGATHDRVGRLDRQLDRLTRMVGDLLDATRIESGDLELKLEDFDLRDAAHGVVDLYTPTTSTHQLTLKAPDRPVVLHGDPLRIEQVISNLVSNAIKYSPGGGPIEVSLSATKREATLCVSDRGMGIPAEELPNLFLPFRRRPAAAELTPGVGLGLSIVRRIVSAHGGQIDVESAVDWGSTFRVRLPLEVRTSRGAAEHRASPECAPAHWASR